MRRMLLVLGVCFCLALPLFGACAQESEAADLTQACEFFAGKSAQKLFRLNDGKHKVAFESPKQVNPALEITAQESIGGLYIEWGDLPGKWTLEAYRGGEWVAVSTGGLSGYAHEYAPVPGDRQIRIVRDTEDKKKILSIIELRVLGQGDTPADIQIWQPTHEKADLLLLVAHPDDEYVFMGGIIPTYAVAQKKNVVVAFMTYATQQRRGELLDALWHAGVKNYPVLGAFGDHYSYNLEDGYKRIGGERDARRFVVSLFRQYRPEVVVSHDVRGEYGHGMHMVCADACKYAFDKAASADYTTERYGVWEVKKLYLHLYAQDQIMLDWETPLTCYGGKTALEVAAECYTYHVSQYSQQAKVKYNKQWYRFGVYPHDMFDNALFGLYASRVGEDVEKNDFLENIPAAQ